MENFETLTTKLKARNEEIAKIDQEIEQITGQAEELKSKYPKLLTPRSPEAKQYLEKADQSDWREDDVQILTENEKEFVIKNLSKLERLEKKITDAKISAGEIAFKLIAMTEQNSRTFDRDSATADIADKKKEVEKAIEDIRQLDSTQVHFSYSGYRTDPMHDQNGALAAAVALLKPKSLYGKRINFKELVGELNDEFKIDMDQKSRDMVKDAYNDLIKKLDDLYRQKAAL